MDLRLLSGLPARRLESFDDARAAFEAAWSVFFAKRTEADFETYRRHQAFEAWKQAMWDAGLKLPTQVAEGCSVCFCGAAISNGDVERHVLAAHMTSRPDPS